MDASRSMTVSDEQIYYSSLVPRTYLCTRLLETLE